MPYSHFGNCSLRPLLRNLLWPDRHLPHLPGRARGLVNGRDQVRRGLDSARERHVRQVSLAHVLQLGFGLVRRLQPALRLVLCHRHLRLPRMPEPARPPERTVRRYQLQDGQVRFIELERDDRYERGVGVRQHQGRVRR